MGEVIRRVSYEIGMQVSESDALGRPDGDQAVMVEVGTDEVACQAWVRIRHLGDGLLTCGQAYVLAEALASVEEELADGKE